MIIIYSNSRLELSGSEAQQSWHGMLPCWASLPLSANLQQPVKSVLGFLPHSSTSVPSVVVLHFYLLDCSALAKTMCFYPRGY